MESKKATVFLENRAMKEIIPKKSWKRFIFTILSIKIIFLEKIVDD